MQTDLDGLLRRVNCYRNVARVRADVIACITQVRWSVGRSVGQMLGGDEGIMEGKSISTSVGHAPHPHPHAHAHPLRHTQTQVRTLIPKIERLIHNNGMESELLVLAGTVAINYQGKQYNIPVEVYVSEPYPDAPPRCYVRPTRDMEITMGHRHVDREVRLLIHVNV